MNKYKQLEINFYMLYPNGFEDEEYLTSKKRYDDSKIKEIFTDYFNLENLKYELESNDLDEIISKVIKVVNSSNFISRFEKIAFRNYIKHSEIHFDLIQALYVIKKDGVETGFDQLSEILEAFKYTEDNANAAKWPIIATFMYYMDKNSYPVKPNTTKKIAKYLEFDIEYKAKPNYNTYLKINEMYEQVRLNTGLKDKRDVHAMCYLALN